MEYSRIAKAVFVAALLSAASAFLSASQSVVLQPPGYRVDMTAAGYHRIIANGYSSYGIPGYPDLPARVVYVAVPPDVDIQSIAVAFPEAVMSDLGRFRIKELPPLATWDGQRQTVAPFRSVYEEDRYFPEKPVEYLGFSQLRKWKIVRLKFTPFQYNPVTGNLRVVSSLAATVQYRQPEARVTSAAALADRVMEDRARDLLVNYSEARNWYQPAVPLPGLQATSDYVIITTNAIESASTQIAGFTAYLSSKGFSPLIVTEDDFGGLTGQAPNGTAEKIRQWLIDNYVALGINYVLLIGNPDPSAGDIPMKMCWPRYSDASYRESPTDYFYADLTGNWDLDGNGYFGDYGGDRGSGGVDFINEVYVGRIPVYSGVASLDSVLSKIMSYGYSADTAWRRQFLIPMSYSDSTTDGAYLGEAMVNNYLSPSGIGYKRLYMQGSLCTAADSSFASEEELVSGATLASWSAKPYGMVLWWGHGSSTSASLGYSGCGWGTIFSTSNAPALDNNHPSFVYQCSCTNGFPEASNNLGTALLYNGAVSTVSASRVSWYAVTSWHTGLKYLADNASIGYYYAQELVTNSRTAAEALFTVKSDMGSNGGWWGGTSWMNLYDFNLYGDPATSLLSGHTVAGHVRDTDNSPIESVSMSYGDPETLDQAQAAADYGYGFWAGNPHWQEFTPTASKLARLDLLIARNGTPGDVVLSLTDPEDQIVWQYTIGLDQVPLGQSWVSVPVEPSLGLVPEQVYKVQVQATLESSAPENRYFWDGKTGSSYNRGVTDVEGSLPGFDFGFRTYGGDAAVSTDAEGFYRILVPAGWSGTVSPAKAGHEFSPASRSYAGLLSSSYGQDYARTNTKPGVTTAAVTSITPTGAVSGGTVISDGGWPVTARGVCWSIDPNPTLEDPHSSNGTGIGVFVSNLTGLIPATQYYVRAYATNAVDTAYGQPLTFTTPVITYTLSLAKAGTGGGKVRVGSDPTLQDLPFEGVFTAGLVFEIEAVPDAGSEFMGWSGDLVSSANPAGVTMDGNKSITVNLNLIPPYRLTLTKLGGLGIPVHDLFVSGRYAYCAAESEGLYIIDIGDVLSPQLIGHYDTPGQARSVFVSGNYAYIAESSYGLRILDVSNPESPSFVGLYDTPGYAYDVAVSGSLAYVADYNGGLQIVNIANPSSPAYAGSSAGPGHAYDVFVCGPYAFVANQNAGMHVINVSNTASPSVVSYYSLSWSDATAVFVKGRYAYLADWFYGLLILDLANPASPALAGNYSMAHAYEVFVKDDYAYVSDWDGGLQVIYVQNPAQPVLAASYDTPGTNMAAVARGGNIYLADYDNFAILSVAEYAKDDFAGTWDGQGVFYRNSDTGGWVKKASPATMIAVGNLDGDRIDDLIGLWPTQGGIWVQYSLSGTWARLSSTAVHIAGGEMNGDGREDLLGTWDGQGAYYRDSMTGSWVKLASAATMITAGDIDGDGTDDLIGIWPTQGGVWVKYSSSGTWERLSTTARDIASGDMNGDGRDDLLCSWDGQGVYYRDSVSRAWVRMASPADQVTCGDLDGDGIDDLIGIWPTQGGVWAKYSKTGGWARLSSTARDIAAGKMRAAGGGAAILAAQEALELPLPMGGSEEGPAIAGRKKDLSGNGPGGGRFVYMQEKNLVPAEDGRARHMRVPGPGEPGFVWVEQENTFPGESRAGERTGTSGRKVKKGNSNFCLFGLTLLSGLLYF